MRLRMILLMVAVVCIADTAHGQQPGGVVQPGRYRLAFSVSPLGQREGFGISASSDLASRFGSRLVMRGDATVFNDGNRGLSALTVDAAYRIGLGPLAVYPLLGAGIADRGMSIVAGGGADFDFRGRALFSEFRMYDTPRHEVGLLKIGLRF